MEAFAKNLRQRAQDLGLAHAEVARRVGLSESRFGHYITGRNEPDLAMLVRIAEVLQTTPSDLLAMDGNPEPSARQLRLDRVSALAARLSDEDLELVLVQMDAILGLRRKAGAAG